MIEPRSTKAYKLEKENREFKKEIELLKVNCNIGYEELKVACKYEYQNVYEIESNYKLEQLKELLIHDYYIDTLKIANVLGKVTKIF